MRIIQFWLLSLCAAATAFSQTPNAFRVTTVKNFDEEFGLTVSVNLFAGNREFGMVQPRSWASHTDSAGQTLSFLSPDNKVSISVKVSSSDGAKGVTNASAVASSPQATASGTFPASQTGTPSATANTAAAPTETAKAPDPLDPIRARVLQRFTDAKITEEYPLSARGMSGPAFFFTYSPSAGRRIFCGIAFLAFDGGEMEVSLVTSSAQSNGQPDLARFVNTIELKKP